MFAYTNGLLIGTNPVYALRNDSNRIERGDSNCGFTLFVLMALIKTQPGHPFFLYSACGLPENIF